MGMAATAKHWTTEMVRALPDDGKRYEIIDGELFVTPAPTWQHGDAVYRLCLLLGNYVSAHPVAHVKIAPQDVEYDAGTMVEPDIFAVPLVSGRRPRTWKEAGRLLLAVEVLSPGTARADREIKRRLYQRQCVPEYWIVDVDARVVERWRPDDTRPEVLAQTIEWQPNRAHPALAIDLVQYFANVVGE